jgi:hypothetical protein
MLCSNCGKDIPFAGNVCPHCRANKARDQLGHMLATAGAFAGGMAGAFAIGWKGLLVGLVLGAFGGIALAKRLPQKPPQ